MREQGMKEWRNERMEDTRMGEWRYGSMRVWEYEGEASYEYGEWQQLRPLGLQWQ